MEWMKRNKLRWFENIERMKSEDFVKKVYVSKIVGPNSRGRLLGKWKDRVKGYMCERVLLEGGSLNNQGGSVWIKRSGGSPTVATPPPSWETFLNGASRQSYRSIDWQIDR